MKKELNPNRKYDYITSLNMAHYFCEIGFQLTNFEKEKKNVDVYSFFVGASNLGIGIELYLKSFIAFSGTEHIPKTHKLKNLYLQINSQLRDKIVRSCKEKNIFHNDTKTLYVRGAVDKPNTKSPYKSSKSIEELLEKHSNLFVDFRYMFSKAREKEEHFIVELENLQIFVNSLEFLTKEILK